MKFQRFFYDSYPNFKNLSFKKIVFGILLGLSSAIVIYSFFYVVREAHRVLALGILDFDYWGFQNGEYILSETNRGFYNLFFSGLSLIFGNSIAILFIFSRPNNILNRFDSRKKRLINDQVFLTFNFSYWLTKIGFTFGVFSMCCMDFEFLPHFKSLAYLLLIVLYLETWKNLTLLLKKKRFKIQVTHFLILLLLTFGLSKINIVDYKAIDEAFLVNNPIIDFPKSTFKNEKKNNWRQYEIAIKLKLDNEHNLDVFTSDRNRIGLSDLQSYIMNERTSYREELSSFLSVNILADKYLAVKYIKMVEAELYLAGIRRVNYEVYTENKNGGLYIENNIIEKRINKTVLGFKRNSFIKKDTVQQILLPPLPPMPPEIDYTYYDSLSVSIHRKLKIADRIISKETVSLVFKEAINTNILFCYEISDESTYQDYINVLSAHNKAVHELRKENEVISEESRYDSNKAYNLEQLKLKRQFPIHIIEILDKTKKN